MIKESSSVVIA